MYAGMNGTPMSFPPAIPAGLWLFSSTTGQWRLAANSGQPGERRYPSMAYDAARARTVLVGDAMDQNIWEWDGLNWSARLAGSGAPDLRFAKLLYDDHRSMVVAIAQSAIFDWDGMTNTFTWRAAVQGTSTAAFDTASGHLMLYGTTSTWEWNPVTALFTQRPIVTGAGVQPTTVQPIQLSNGRIVAWDYALMWEWNNVTGAWQRRSAIGTGPTARRGPGLAYDSRRGVVTMFGGVDDLIGFPSSISRTANSNNSVFDFDTTFEWIPPPP